jgi:SulP family sulfate permease
VVSLAILVAWNRQALKVAWMRRLPGPLAVLIVMTALNALVALPIDTIGSRFGGIPQEIPTFGLPELSLSTLGKLIAPAITIALLGAIESLLSARVADSQIDDRHDPNQELMAQGIANVAAPLFGRFAATGPIARTAPTIRTGGRTPVDGMIHAGARLPIVLALAPAASHIPLATLSAIVVMVSINMGEWHAFAPRELARYSLNYRTILLGTFFITVVFDLTLAVEIGMALASLFFIYRMSDLTRIERIALADLEGAETQLREDGTPRILAYKLSGSLFFGAANKLENLLLMQDGHPDVVILEMDRVISLDTTGLDILQTLHRNLQKRGAHLILCQLGSQPGSIVFRSGFLDRLGDDNITATLAEAVARARLLSGNEPEIAYA